MTNGRVDPAATLRAATERARLAREGAVAAAQERDNQPPDGQAGERGNTPPATAQPAQR